MVTDGRLLLTGPFPVTNPTTAYLFSRKLFTLLSRGVRFPRDARVRTTVLFGADLVFYTTPFHPVLSSLPELTVM